MARPLQCLQLCLGVRAGEGGGGGSEKECGIGGSGAAGPANAELGNVSDHIRAEGLSMMLVLDWARLENDVVAAAR